MSNCCGGALPSRRRSMSISAASRPASKAGHSTLVSAGVSISAYCEAITESTEKSLGTRRSASRRAASRPLN